MHSQILYTRSRISSVTLERFTQSVSIDSRSIENCQTEIIWLSISSVTLEDEILYIRFYRVDNASYGIFGMRGIPSP